MIKNKFKTIEDKLLKKYWDENPGLLFKEVKLRNIVEVEQRTGRVDGIIVPSEEKKVYCNREYKMIDVKKAVKGNNVKVIEVKKLLNRDVIGQAEVATYLIEKQFNPKKASPVVVCGRSHPDIKLYCDYKNIELFVMSDFKKIFGSWNVKNRSVKRRVEKILGYNAVFTNRDVRVLTEDDDYADLFLHNLVKNGQTYRLTRGCYSWVEDPFLSVFCFKPAYLGLEFALSYYEVWDQETNPAIITYRRIRAGTREVLGTNVNLYRIKFDYFFGVDYLSHDEFYLPISNIEKTILDLIYFNRVPDKEVWSRLLKRADRKRLDSYIKKYPQRTQVKMRNQI